MAAQGTGNASTGGFGHDVLVVGSGFGGSVAALRLGEPYRRIAPVPPRHPAVPAHAPAALRLGPRPGPEPALPPS